LEDGQVVIAAHTNKNWLSIQRDLDKVSEVAILPPYEDQEDLEAKEKGV